MVDRQARKRIQVLEEHAVQRDFEIAELSSTVSWLKATVEAIRVSCLLHSPAVPPNPPAPETSAPSVSATKPRKASSSAEAPDPRQPIPPAPQAQPPAPLPVALPAPPPGFFSLIVADFPALFAEFREKRFTLLWRGSRDGFGARDFHGRCGGHAPTLILIQDTAGNIFGGFTPVELESRKWNGKCGPENNCWKADPSLKSFLFTLKNPHNFPARKFALKAEVKDGAIDCSSGWGPCFGNDLWLWNNCNANANDSRFGRSYANDTLLPGDTVLTG
jgi:hypothetical protein